MAFKLKIARHVDKPKKDPIKLKIERVSDKPKKAKRTYKKRTLKTPVVKKVLEKKKKIIAKEKIIKEEEKQPTIEVNVGEIVINENIIEEVKNSDRIIDIEEQKFADDVMPPEDIIEEKIKEVIDEQKN